MSNAIVGGSLLLKGSGGSAVLAQTAQAGTSDMTLSSGAATMSVHLPAGAFPAPVPFTISLVAPEPMAKSKDNRVESTSPVVTPLQGS